jgi:hypothetical protein
MGLAGGEGNASHDRASGAHAFAHSVMAESAGTKDLSTPGLRRDAMNHSTAPRRTPRVSLVVVLPENHSISAERVARSLGAHGDQPIDVLVACAGQPTNLIALQQTIGAAQYLLAPAGTSAEDLRALAMRQAPGDIVTLLSGALPPEGRGQPEQFITS